MTAELGGLTGIVAPDAETVRFLRERRGVDVVIEPWMHSDPDAVYAATLRVDCQALPGRASISPTEARAPPASVKISMHITTCWPGPWRAA
ncbi:hypothetical protein G6F57_014457 [Rhizopus arrhizus]|nr:hypothetical protein G6F57_014457 [Rhizopus arrhizus]